MTASYIIIVEIKLYPIHKHSVILIELQQIFFRLIEKKKKYCYYSKYNYSVNH